VSTLPVFGSVALWISDWAGGLPAPLAVMRPIPVSDCTLAA